MSRVTFLTGASSGIGSALAPLLAADGDRVVLTARRLEPLETLVQQIRDNGGEALAIALDVTDRDAVHAAVRQTEEHFGPVDILIANAGIGDPTPGDDFDALRFERIVRTNLLGVSYCIEAVTPSMIERGQGQIVGVASLAGYRGLPGAAAYCASKSGLMAMLQSLRIDLRPYGIAVTTVCPGFVKTPLTDRNRFRMPFLLELDDGARRIRRAIRSRAREVSFPFLLAFFVRLARYLPNGIYDRLLRGRGSDKELTES
jgi:NAD(P)-dependent dehydrogenase (short-subunit alcohol dehydrogenase family)